jgi:uncharacterized damage-inducible protein DinB
MSRRTTTGRQRLKALLTRISDTDMARRVGQHWTVSVALMHLAFWDRLWLAKFEEWERIGVVKCPQQTPKAIQRR